ncbi:hypothetical protein EHQ12_18600 [Leptospira gomenensis]|uniref:hypothetical protein n=1 Tax=Leptospira gomenensis TaxID=2484974 RepID=UPI001083D96F|nr:hypothetical protein [Leptospira gomenensis]TGK32616.1 hypothetical protein EHQ12_18600 [Leptospira gomenensis]
MSNVRKEVLIATILFLLSVLFLFPNLWSREVLSHGDEEMHIGRSARVFKQEKYFFPGSEGFKNLYKPPLLFWARISSDLAFGMSLSAERLPLYCCLPVPKY